MHSPCRGSQPSNRFKCFWKPRRETVLSVVEILPLTKMFLILIFWKMHLFCVCVLCNWRYSTSLYWTHSLDGNICAAVPQFNRKGKLQRLIFTDQDIRQHLVASLPPSLMSKGLLTMCCGKPASCSILLWRKIHEIQLDENTAWNWSYVKAPCDLFRQNYKGIMENESLFRPKM